MIAKTGEISFTNTDTINAQDISVTIPNPLTVEPDAIYDMGHNIIGNHAGVSITYNTDNTITFTLSQVSASTTIKAEFFIVKRHSIENGSTIKSAIVNSSTTSVDFSEKPDLVLVKGGDFLTSAEQFWRYDEVNKKVHFYNLGNNLEVDIIKFHSIQFNQNGISNADGYLENQYYMPDFVISSVVIGTDKWYRLSNIDLSNFMETYYDQNNKTFNVWSPNVECISIPIHSIFRG